MKARHDPWLVQLASPVETLRDGLGEVVATYRPAGWRVKEIRLSKQSYKALIKAGGLVVLFDGEGATFQGVPVVRHSPDFDEIVLEQGPEQGEVAVSGSPPQAGGPQGHGPQPAEPTKAGAG